MHGFFEWVRSLGLVRGDDRWLAGVCGAIAARTGLDPIIIRGVAIVAAIFGAPVLAVYIAAWVLLPNAQNEIVAQRVVAGRIGGREVWAIIAVAVIVFSLFGGAWTWWAGSTWWAHSWGAPVLGVIWTLLVVGGVIALVVALSNRKKTQDPGVGGHGDPAYQAQASADSAQGRPQGTGMPETGPGAGQGAAQQSDAGNWEQWAQTFTVPTQSKEPDAYGVRSARRVSRAPASLVLISLGAVLLVGAAAGVTQYLLAGGYGIAKWYPDAIIVAIAAMVAAAGLAMVLFGMVGFRAPGVATLAVLGCIALAIGAPLASLPSAVEFGDVRVGTSSTQTESRSLGVVGGDVVIDANEFTVGSTIDVSTIGGDVDVWLAPVGQYRIDTRTVGGRTGFEGIESSSDQVSAVNAATILLDDGQIVTGLADAAGYTTIRVNTVGGDLTLSMIGSSPTGTGQPAQKEVPTHE